MPLPGLKQFSWHIVDNENNVNDPVLTWNRLFTDVADSHAPLKKCRVKGTPAPWMNNKIAEAMRDRNYHLGKAQKSNSTYHWGMYRKLRKFVSREIKSSKSTYYCNLIEESKGDSGLVWKAASEASSRNVSSSIPQCVIACGVCMYYCMHNKMIPNPLLQPCEWLFCFCWKIVGRKTLSIS